MPSAGARRATAGRRAPRPGAGASGGRAAEHARAPPRDATWLLARTPPDARRAVAPGAGRARVGTARIIAASPTETASGRIPPRCVARGRGASTTASPRRPRQLLLGPQIVSSSNRVRRNFIRFVQNSFWTFFEQGILRAVVSKNRKSAPTGTDGSLTRHAWLGNGGRHFIGKIITHLTDDLDEKNLRGLLVVQEFALVTARLPA